MKNMSKTMYRLLALVMAMAMVFGLAASGNSAPAAPAADSAPAASNDAAPAEDAAAPAEADTRLAAEVYPETFDASTWTDVSKEVYDAALGEYLEYYTEAKEAEDLSEPFALMAIAEAKIMESGVMIPLTTRGGRYSISRVAPRTINSTLWGNDSDRFHNAVVATELIKPADRDAIKAKWVELAGTGTFEAWVKEYLTEQGYTLKDSYTIAYTSDPQTWDALATSRTADSEAIVNTYDGLMEYDIENVQQPALATGYTVSDDGLTYTFTIRDGAVWVDSQGRKVADVTADDFVAGMQHMLDAQGGLEYLVGADGCNIKGADAYINGEVTDFAEVGVKALDEHTLEYTLEAPCSFFTTMLGYNCFGPMNRDYFVSQGGKFGAEYDAEAADYLYGKDPDHIAYSGPYLVTNATEANTIVFKANPSYWNKDNINIQTLTWIFEDGSDELNLLNNAVSGVIDGCGLSPARLEAAKKDGTFDNFAYVSDTDATSYMGFLNINRQQFANFNDPTVAVSGKTVTDAERTTAAMQNVHFRRAFVASLDRGSYNAQTEGEELKLNSLRNAYTPGTFVSLPEEVTVSINGTDTTFPAGTFYGEIMQAQIDADGVAIKVWDAEADGGIGSSDGFDGWYNPDFAKAELATAVEELAAAGVEVSAENPIQIDLPCWVGNESYANRGNVFKQSVESVSDGLIVMNLVPCNSADDWYYAGYYPDYGYEMNADVMDVSGWCPDYGDPQTYLDTMLPDYAGYMVKSIGMF